jgi:hypothetical protein
MKTAHGFAQTDTVKHCPFCGSGDVWGGSDGTITCEFDGATFQVSVEPQYPSAPGNINGQPLDMDGQPNPMGQADAEDAMAVPEGMSPSSGESLGMGEGDEEDMGAAQDEGSGGGLPWEKGQDEDEDEDEEDEDERAGLPRNLSPRLSYRTFAGDALPEELYLKHLAIRHVEEPRRFLASLRATAEVINRKCPDFNAHNKHAEQRASTTLGRKGDIGKFWKQVSDWAKEDYEACEGKDEWAHNPNFDEAYENDKRQGRISGRFGSLRTSAYNPSRGYDSYEEAAEATVSHKQAKDELARHGHDMADLEADLGKRDHYSDQEVLDWLGY